MSCTPRLLKPPPRRPPSPHTSSLPSLPSLRNPGNPILRPNAMHPSTAPPPNPPQPSALRRAPQRSQPQSFEPVPFRARPCAAPGTEISRPVPLRSRATSFCATGVCPGCSGTTPGACRSGRPWSLGETRSPHPPPHRVVSFGSAVTPLSGASTDGEDAPRSWEWPSDDDTGNRRHASASSQGSRGERRRAVRLRPASRSDSESSDQDWTGSAKLDRAEWSTRGSRYRGASARSQSALVENGCCNTPRADGPRPWDMTEGQGKNFASFGFRKTIDRGVSFGDTLSSKHLLKNGVKGAVGAVRGDEVHRGGKRVLKFLKKLRVSRLKSNSGAADA